MAVLTAACLPELADRLARHGLRVRLAQPIGRPPTLHVSNPATPGLAEDVVFDGTGLWWPWGDRVATDDLETAAESICRVLGLGLEARPGVYSTPSRIG